MSFISHGSCNSVNCGRKYFLAESKVSIPRWTNILQSVGVMRNASCKACSKLGVSRPTFYQAKSDFDDMGIVGLVPKKRGPRGPNKLQGEVLAFIKERLSPGQPIRARDLVALVRDEFGLDVHPRTIERAVAGKKTAQ